MRFLATLPLLLFSSSCATASEPTEGACRTETLGQFVGRQETEELGREMLRASGASMIRWVPLHGVVTMDFNSARLTVQLDGQNRVQSTNCG